MILKGKMTKGIIEQKTLIILLMIFTLIVLAYIVATNLGKILR
ncbi:MAG: hypothetical protein QXK37_02235 [Candidatus Woesearchaeota archaeon]